MNKNKGFTLIELLVVVAIIGVLATIVMAVLSSGKTRSRDAKIVAQVSQMTSQSFLFSGSMVAPSPTVIAPYQVSEGITGASTNGTTTSGTLFNATSQSLNSLYLLASTLPGDTYIYYGWDGGNPNLTGKWFFAASTSTGAFCNDNKGTKKVFEGTPPDTAAEFTAIGVFPNAIAGTTGYRCD